MKKSLIVFLSFAIVNNLRAQVSYDSITISRSTIENNWYGVNWSDSLKAGKVKNYMTQEKTIWIKPQKAQKTLPLIISLTNRIKSNGTGDVTKCFIPRHSINYYKEGKIVRYLLVCFECDGVHFSDETKMTFVKNLAVRDKQMAELKMLFKDML